MTRSRRSSRPARLGGATALAIILMTQAAPARDETCPRAVDSSVRLEVQRPEPVLDTRRSMAQLRGMGDGASAHDSAIGLYVTNLKAGLEIDYQIRRRGSEACFWVSEATVTVAYPERTIYIARELERGSCGYKVALAHEFRHAGTDDAVLAAELPRLQRKLTEAMARIGVAGPFPAGELQGRRDAIAEELDAVMRREIDRVWEVRRKALAKLDTPEAYRRESELCPGGMRDR